MAALRHIAAIRSRLLQSTVLVPLLALTADGSPAVYAASIWSVKEPVYPCVTLFQPDANLAVWAPRLIDPGTVTVECFTKLNSRQASEMEEACEAMLHKQEVLTNSTDARFAELRKANWSMSMWDDSVHCWRTSTQYLIRSFVS